MRALRRVEPYRATVLRLVRRAFQHQAEEPGPRRPKAVGKRQRQRQRRQRGERFVVRLAAAAAGGGGKAGGGSGGGAGAGGGADGADVGSSGGGSAAAARGVNGAAGADSASGEDCKDGGGGPDGGDAKGRGGEGVANSKAARTDDGEGKGGPSSADGGGSRGGRRNGAGLSTKTCPACGHVNQLSRLSCMLCAAKFSVKQTAQLLQQRHMGDAQGGTTRYAELETGLDPDLEANGSVDPSSAEISANAFKLLPEEAQIQVMQEKAAHRLLAQTLHQQMLEELHTNPALAADPEQQLQFKRLAQQQLLYQMALAAQAAAPPQNERNGRRVTAMAPMPRLSRCWMGISARSTRPRGRWARATRRAAAATGEAAATTKTRAATARGTAWSASAHTRINSRTS